MKNNLLEKQIPTLLGIILIGVAVFFTARFTKNVTIFTGFAGPSQTPKEVRIANITDTSFTVSYHTDDSVIGSLQIGETTNPDLLILDDRDRKSSQSNSYRIHYFTVGELKPETRYYFSIISGQNTYQDSNTPFSIKTGPHIDVKSSNNTKIKGTIILPEGTSPTEAVIYLKGTNTQKISTFTQNDTYSLDMIDIRSSDLLSKAVFSPDSKIEILIIAGTYQSQIQTTFSLVNNLPLVRLSNDYDFVQNSSPIVDPNASESAELKFPSLSAKEASRIPQILSPKNEEAFSDQQPVFKGTAPPGESISVEIHSDEAIKTQVKSDASGSWSYRPPKALSPGEHTITIVTRDAKGILRTISRSFVVYAEGSSFTDPSVSPIQPSSTPTSKPTLIPTKAPSPTVSTQPTPSSTPTITPLPTPTAILLPTSLPTQIPISVEKIAPPGNSTVTTISIVGIVTTTIGIILFLLSKGTTL